VNLRKVYDAFDSIQITNHLGTFNPKPRIKGFGANSISVPPITLCLVLGVFNFDRFVNAVPLTGIFAQQSLCSFRA
jgi:hypothetical protein